MQKDTILSLYEAFGRGDVDTILAGLTDDVRWTCNLGPAVPWSCDYTGKADVPKFFAAIYNSVDVLGFDPQEFISEGDTLVSMGTFGCRVKATGKESNARWIFVWRFRGDKVCGYEQFHGPELEAAFRA